MRSLCALALLAVATATGCDYFLMGTHTGICDEPVTLTVPDAGDRTTLHKAQCQVMSSGPMGSGPGDVCCRAREKYPNLASMGHTSVTDNRPQCLYPQDCYVGKQGEGCYSDTDCDVGLACLDDQQRPVLGSMSSVEASRTIGTCQCPADAMSCITVDSKMYCCGGGTVCGMGSCVVPGPPDAGGGPPEPILDLAMPSGRDGGAKDASAASDGP